MPGGTARDLRLYHRLQLAAHAVAKYSDQQVREAVGLTTPQVAVLSVVADAGRSQREIAGELGVNESAVTGMVNRLLGSGLVEREVDASDGRAWVLRLTPNGRSALRRAARAFERVNAALEQAVPASEIGRLAEHLTTIADVARDRRGTSR